jgi:hypothetical protein
MSKHIYLQLYHWISDGIHNQIVEEGQGDFNLQKRKKEEEKDVLIC